MENGNKGQVIELDGVVYAWNGDAWIALPTTAEVADKASLVDANTFTDAVQVFSALPTADPVNAGQLWNNLGVLNISAGA